jgi:alpha-tubulin suppressor-like RCC1 family protein
MSVAPGLLYISNEGGTQQVENLLGRTFYAIDSSNQEVIAVCNDGVHGVSQDAVRLISSLSIKSIASGNEFYLATDESNSLYSWGTECVNGQVQLCCSVISNVVCY